ncbi:uncharacterized protein LOC104883153 [Beta vulgaris subsp. vulgaris]|uniref:uncharacterized protein LOC104883153 n=1 Tax=Beta vulgaris subsp. vulgaris TaxID=3555 RepID=UPI00053F696C|nr:uncharacterized protein LOC104883153 [Beta vulgaris subsp. vulgaris]
MTNFIVPDGYKLLPTLKELLFTFLKPKIFGEELPLVYGFSDVDLYSVHPRELFNVDMHSNEEDDETHRYVFTQLKKKNYKGEKYNRRIDEVGTWRGEFNNEIEDEHGNIIGYDKYFKFVAEEKGKGKEKEKEKDDNCKVEYTMHEYSFAPNYDHDQLLPRQPNEDIVLCRIAKKLIKGNRRATNKRGRGVICMR